METAASETAFLVQSKLTRVYENIPKFHIRNNSLRYDDNVNNVPGRPQKTTTKKKPHDSHLKLRRRHCHRTAASLTAKKRLCKHDGDRRLFANWRIISNFNNPTVKNWVCNGRKTLGVCGEDLDKAMSWVQEKRGEVFLTETRVAQYCNASVAVRHKRHHQSGVSRDDKLCSAHWGLHTTLVSSCHTHPVCAHACARALRRGRRVLHNKDASHNALIYLSVCFKWVTTCWESPPPASSPVEQQGAVLGWFKLGLETQTDTRADLCVRARLLLCRALSFPADFRLTNL